MIIWKVKKNCLSLQTNYKIADYGLYILKTITLS